MATSQSVARKKVWGIRAVWVLIAFSAYLFIAITTSTPYVNVEDRPLLSLVTVVLVVYSYPWMKKKFGLTEE